MAVDVGMATGFVKGCLGAPARQRDAPVVVADDDGAQVAAEQGAGQAGFAAGGDGRRGAFGFVGDRDSR
ncbi:hypothetical protein CG747_36475 [Streptomyces sp. CB02959]|nr:hypothetical protein CG747_36475 [Streptomyces sp. CB02959]